MFCVALSHSAQRGQRAGRGQQPGHGAGGLAVLDHQVLAFGGSLSGRQLGHGGAGPGFGKRHVGIFWLGASAHQPVLTASTHHFIATLPASAVQFLRQKVEARGPGCNVRAACCEVTSPSSLHEANDPADPFSEQFELIIRYDEAISAAGRLVQFAADRAPVACATDVHALPLNATTPAVSNSQMACSLLHTHPCSSLTFHHVEHIPGELVFALAICH